MMDNEWEINREALAKFHGDQMKAQLKKSGDWTRKQEKAIHREFMRSDALQKLVDASVEHLQAHLGRRVH